MATDEPVWNGGVWLAS